MNIITKGHKIKVPKNLRVLHTVLPYYFSFKNGAWFRWEKNKNSVVAYDPISSARFNIERKKDKVLVKCDNNFELFFHDYDKYRLLYEAAPYVFYGKGRFNYKGSEAKVGSGKTPCDFYKDNRLKKIIVKVVGWKRSCKYHRKMGREFDLIVPKGFCVFAYHNLYPYALAMLYDGKPSRIRISCPGLSNSILMEIKAFPRKLSVLYNLAEKTLRFIGFPQDIIDKKVKIKILEVKGKCPINIKKGNLFNFNTSDRHELCPCSFNTLLPFIMSKLSNPSENISIKCPSEVCRIEYKIIKK